MLEADLREKTCETPAAYHGGAVERLALDFALRSTALHDRLATLAQLARGDVGTFRAQSVSVARLWRCSPTDLLDRALRVGEARSRTAGDVTAARRAVNCWRCLSRHRRSRRRRRCCSRFVRKSKSRDAPAAMTSPRRLNRVPMIRVRRRLTRRLDRSHLRSRLGSTAEAQGGRGARIVATRDHRAQRRRTTGRYTYRAHRGTTSPVDGGFRGQDIKWAHDYPRGERHFTKIFSELSSIAHVRTTVSNVILTLDDPELTKLSRGVHGRAGLLAAERMQEADRPCGII